MYEKENRTLTCYDCINELTNLKRTYPWLHNVDSTALKNAIRDLDDAYKQFFKSLKSDYRIGFPKPRKNNYKQSYRSQNVGGNNPAKANIKVFDNCIRLPKLGDVKAKISRTLEGRVLSATVTRTSTNKYYVTINATNVENKTFEKTEKVIGIDLGIHCFAVDSNGVEYSISENLEKSQKQLNKLQHQLSKKEKYSNNRQKARKKVAKKYEQIRNQRDDILNKLTTEIVNDPLGKFQIAVNGCAKTQNYPFSAYNECGTELICHFDYRATKSFTVTQNGVMCVLIRKSNDTNLTANDVKDIHIQISVDSQVITMPYTLRSVGDIKDEVDFNRGVYAPKTVAPTYDGSSDEKWQFDAILKNCYIAEYMFKGVQPNERPKITSTITNEVMSKNENHTTSMQGICLTENGTLVFRLGELTSSLETWIAFLQANPIKVIGERPTPTETPLTETELNAYRQLYTNKGNTTVLSEADMQLDYYVNKPNAQAIGNVHSQVNKDYFKLQQAIISTGGN